MKAGIVMSLAEQRGGIEGTLMKMLRANRAGPNIDYTLAFLEQGPMVDAVRALSYAATVIETGRLRQVRRYARAVRDFRRWLAEEQADVVLSWDAKAHLYSGPAALSLRIPAIWYMHSLPERTSLEQLVMLVPARRVFCSSTAQAVQAERTLRPKRPMHVVYIAVDLDRFDPTALPPPQRVRARKGLPQEGPLIGMVARLQRWKGVHVFLEAAARVAEAVPEAQFVVVGGEHWSEPDYLSELSSQAEASGIADRVIFAGHQDDVELWMQAADILVHASFDEPAGNVIIEGMALGKAVVAARSRGPMEFVEEGVDGLMAAPGDAVELGSAITRLALDAEERRRLGTAAREHARRFSSARLASDVADHLADVVEAR